MDEIIYVSEYNHAIERHLNKGILETLTRPMLLICGARNALRELPKRQERDMELAQQVSTLCLYCPLSRRAWQVKQTLLGRGSVLIPVDTSGRVLELLLLLDQIWAVGKLKRFPIVLLSTQAVNVLQAAATMLEWMSDVLNKQFQNTAELPFALPTVQRCRSMEELAAFGATPMLVLASVHDLESGFARELFVRWAGYRGNLVVCPERGEMSLFLSRFSHTVSGLPGSLLHTVSGGRGGLSLNIQLSKRVALEGEELVAYHRAQEISRLQELERARLLSAQQDMLDAQDADDELQEQLLEEETPVLVNPYFKGAHPHDLFVAPDMDPPPMFPFTDRKRTLTLGEWTPYGAAIDADQFQEVAPEQVRETSALFFFLFLAHRGWWLWTHLPMRLGLSCWRLPPRLTLWTFPSLWTQL